ncbi:hypothetical protein Taro_025991 [Colocasia esculenta]|uniref:Uncharacterized protein n=1 Tax=Colocasia esculenta TaxID=4460 RepID=A0A843V4Z7_COLES|nr:hypothetical protein [Colocasia esculenta]
MESLLPRAADADKDASDLDSDLAAAIKSLCSLKFSDICMGPKAARMIFCALQQTSSGLVNLDISDDNIPGWLSSLNKESMCLSLISSSSSKGFLNSLCVLNLRGNNLGKDDAEDLKYALLRMPSLRRLDISDNPLTDDGIRSLSFSLSLYMVTSVGYHKSCCNCCRCLIPYFLEAFENSSLSDIKIENCSLSSSGVIQLLENIQNLREPLHSLSLADNELGSCMGVPLGKFLGASRVKELNIEGVGLGPLGFQELESGMPGEVDLTYINVSKNRGRMKAADFVSKIILQAPELHVINAGYNFIPSESLPVICNALKHSKGKLERLDLTGNDQLSKQGPASALAEFCFQGKGIVVLPSLPSTAPYDDDP